ncbi:MAG: PEP-CTERM sorting domain-containing protein [Phycisphaerales bacterium]|nr:PEP-CTERM sorting domain-containing protein [Phycisphaerales bacterium]
MSFAKSLLMGAVVCGIAGVGTARGAYFLEAENYTDYLGSPSPAPVIWAEGTGPFSGEQMSGDAYLEVIPGSYTTFQIPANTIPAGTYYPAVRSDSGSGHGIFIDRATSLETPLGSFGVYGLTYNPESGTPGVFGWDWVENYNNSNEFVSIIINPGEANTLRINSATGGNISVDMIAFLDSNTELPTGIPEPASMGLFAGAGLLFIRRRRA